MMLNLQKHLTDTKDLEYLSAELGIRVYEHPSLPLLGFKYNQIDSPKLHPIVREARGVVLEKDSWRLIAKPFSRFFNVGEHQDEYSQFDWNNFVAQTKEDGSLAILYHYAGEWHVNTSGSFGLQEAQQYSGSWRDLFWDTLKKDSTIFQGNEDKTFVFELCTPYNKIVRQYRKPEVYLLSMFRVSPFSHKELSMKSVDAAAEKLGLKRPNFFDFLNNNGEAQKELTSYLLKKEEEDPTYEGLVLLDKNGLRFKWKTSTYLAMHHLLGNRNLFLPKNLLPIILAGEIAEVLSSFPEAKEEVERIQDILDCSFREIEKLWEEARSIKNQKDFASTVKDHALSSLLFKMRKQNPNGNLSDLHKLWRASGSLLLKKLFK